ncbi:unnamed protein product [Paramecium octaurelia]|uniref:Uncharacterized protein n=1 Tax=Paramecium octaurelia TaxID=43137 RepID=A0A8S1WX54_PAROT|nr:unnamed protein product [Paramecium octaurelia]
MELYNVKEVAYDSQQAWLKLGTKLNIHTCTISQIQLLQILVHYVLCAAQQAIISYRMDYKLIIRYTPQYPPVQMDMTQFLVDSYKNSNTQDCRVGSIKSSILIKYKIVLHAICMILLFLEMIMNLGCQSHLVWVQPIKITKYRQCGLIKKSQQVSKLANITWFRKIFQKKSVHSPAHLKYRSSQFLVSITSFKKFLQLFNVIQQDITKKPGQEEVVKQMNFRQYVIKTRCHKLRKQSYLIHQ